MAISNYGELKTAVANWLERDDLTDRIPEFIELAEDRIAQDPRLRIRPMETSTDLTVNAQEVALPTGFLEARRVYLQGTPLRRLEFLSPENFWIRNLANQAGVPKWFTIEGENIVFGPSPETTYTGKLLYWQRFTALANDTDTNWILSNARGLLLYGALLESAPFLEDDVRALTWSTLFDDTVAKVREADKRDRHSGAPLMSRSDVQIDVGRSASSS